MKFHEANNATFKALIKTGKKQIRDAQYPEALASFQQAEQTTGELTDDQYASLKDSRQKIASLYESSGSDSEAEGAYQTLVNSGIQEGEALQKVNALQRAVPMLQDAEQFSEHLTSTKQAALLESRSALAACLRDLQRYPEAVETTQRMIDSLKAAGDPYDPALTAQYLQLVQTYSRESDWNNAETYSLLALDACDKRVGHLSGLYGVDAPMQAALSDKDLTLYGLMDNYARAGELDRALSTAEDLFNYIAENSKPWGDLGPYPRKEVARRAFLIASQAHKQDAVNTWQRRLVGQR